MKHKKIYAGAIVSVIVVALIAYGLRNYSFPIFQTHGTIADEQKKLILITLALSLLVVIPVFVMTFMIVLKYREGHHNQYKPDWDGSRVAETIWWAVPILIISVLAGITWHSTHALDPFKPLASSQKPINVQVVAMEWKWLFIYPDLKVASLNELHIPTGRAVHFQITGDAPMNSFWIPALGGQIYAMAGMNSELNLKATSNGVYKGSSANLSGKGFADMKFNAIASSNASFDQWISENQRNNNALTSDEYNKLAVPSNLPPIVYYSLKEDDLYNKVMVKYMVPGHEQLKSSDDPEALMASVHGHNE